MPLGELGNLFFIRFNLAFLLILIFSLLSTPAFAISEEEKSFLLLYFKEEEIQVLSATRSLQSIARVAENVEVVTKEDIELMNAHTLAEVLNTVNGVQVLFFGNAPGDSAQVLIQGSDSKHVAVFVDGVSMNFISSLLAEVGAIPVQFIEKIEIIKGPASSAWGSSLGGVINIVTKAGVADKTKGTLSASYGERNTGDFRAEASGGEGRLAYYFTAARLQTDGFRPGNDSEGNNFYAKLSYEISKDTQLLFTAFYTNISRRELEIDPDIFGDKFKNMFGTLELNSSLNNELNLQLSLRYRQDIFKSLTNYVEDFSNKDDNYGASAKVTWKHDVHNVVAGFDYDNQRLASSAIGSVVRFSKWAVFANDTISLGKFAVTPGIRYDYTGIAGYFLSPSLGATYQVVDNAILRAYVARGFSSIEPNLTRADFGGFIHNPDLSPEEVWSFQLGGEAGLSKYLWLKVAAFRHEIRDAEQFVDLPDGFFTVVNAVRQRRQGFEVSIKTTPIYNLSLSAGTTVIYTKDLDTGEGLKGVPTNTYDVALKYDDKKSFKALLQGHYIWWNMDDSNNAKYNAVIWDLNMIKKLRTEGKSTWDIFFKAHNLFNGSQYWQGFYKNARRWIEAGVRLNF